MSSTAGNMSAAVMQPSSGGPLAPTDDQPNSIPLVLGPKHDDLVACSGVMQSIVDQAQRVARTSAPVLITGDSGTGKEVLARLIHRASLRSNQPYVRVNCAALSETLIESELFGHERGAFTGAVQLRVGRFEWAGQGTLLLDEISEIPLRLQAKLLRVLEEEEFQRVGSNEALRMNARVIATSNRVLREEVTKGKFREDLFYRLNVLQLDVPPLRQRREDISPLIDYFMQRFRHEGEVPVYRIADDAMSLLCSYQWPGNVRQLRNVVRRVCVLSRTSTAELADLPELPSCEEPVAHDLYQMSIKDASRVLVRASLQRHRGNRTAAARQLGITVRTLHNWLKRDPPLA